MNTTRINDLRERLVNNLKRLIGNPVIEAKELTAFDLIMNRRQFLKTAQLTAIGALVASAYPPTAWGRHDPELEVDPTDVGLTDAEMASVAQATQLVTGTELFQDTIYAQPVVAPEAVNSHALIEGARGRLRIQSDLLNDNPDEYQFLDTGYHLGPSELIQLEQDENGNWELVHYYHPWSARTDGARTDGLVRQVITDKKDTFSNPTRVVAITGSYTNHFFPQQANQASTVSYMVYVEDLNAGHLFVGHGLSSVPAPYNELPLYPVRWVSGTPNVFFGNADDFLFADKYTSAAWQSSGDNTAPEYAAEQQVEHLVLYYKDFIGVVTLLDVGDADPGLAAARIPLPSGVANARVAHIDWDPTQVGTSDWRRLTNVVLASSKKQSNGNVLYTLFMMNQAANTSASDQDFFAPLVIYTKVTFANNWKQRNVTIAASELQDGELELDYSSLRSVHGLHTTIADGNWYHVKLANFEGRGVCLLTIIKEGPPDEVKSIAEFFLGGHFPLAFPGAAGLGTVTALSGGTSKFGGFRFVAFDADGNAFLMRQRGAEATDTPYASPIYAQFTSTGTPKTTWSNDEQPPASTAKESNLNDLQAWIDASSPGLSRVKSFLLNAALAFGTGDSNVAQATWLGSSFQAVYAPKRSAHDSEHVVVKLVTDGTSDEFNVFNVFNTPVEKTWHSRLIANQVTPGAPGLQESGDFYQATINATNIYGTQVALNSDTNAGMQIEIRGDAPTMVIDQSNNKYYDVDRYTSFVALPDPSSNNLRIAVKAQNFAQILYARLLQTTDMAPSSFDSAMLNSAKASGGTTTDWVQINIAADAQQRMAAGSSGLSLGDDQCDNKCSDSDPTIYICAKTLCNSNAQNTWQTKGGYSPSSSNLDSLAQYLNQSGKNLADASANAANLSLDATPVDPLTSTTSLTSDSGRTPLTTTFDYFNGQITVGGVGTFPSSRQLGGLFSSISHALHDALHWLQNVEGSVYQNLPNGVKIVIDDTENIAVTVSADIMKQVNGVESELQEVVSTVEEYGSVVLNVVVTIVESSFIFRYIELLILLISLFIHLEDIKNLSNSFKNTIRGLTDPNSAVPLPTIDTDFPWGEKLQNYVGSPNNVTSDMKTANIDSVVDEIVNELIDAVLKNPFANKIIGEVMSVLSRAISALDKSSPLQFNLDESIVDSQIQLVDDLADDVESLFVNVTDDALNFLINQVVADIENPQESFSNFASGLGQFMEQVETDTIDAVTTGLGEIVATDTNIINELMNQDDLMVLDIALLADLFRLFGIGNVSGNKVQLAAADVISLPLALIVWTGIFMGTGVSISSVDDLNPGASFSGEELGVSTNDKLTFANATVAALTMTVNGALWTYAKAQEVPKAPPPTTQVPMLGDIVNLIRWLMSATTMSIQFATQQPSFNWTNGYLPVFTYSRLVTGITSFAIRVLGKNNAIGNWKPTDIVTAVNGFLNLVAIVWSVADAITEEINGSKLSGKDWAILAGNDVGRAGVFGKLLYAWYAEAAPESAKDSLIWFSLYVIGTAAAGFGAAATATGVKKFSSSEPSEQSQGGGSSGCFLSVLSKK